ATTRRIQSRAAGCGDRHILSAALSRIDGRRSGGGIIQPVGPQQFSGLAIEGAEARIVGTTDESESAGRQGRAAIAGTAGFFLAFRNTVGDAQYDAPSDIAGVGG